MGTPFRGGTTFAGIRGIATSLQIREITGELHRRGCSLIPPGDFQTAPARLGNVLNIAAEVVLGAVRPKTHPHIFAT
jgi:hypothetical protein